jgi:hypothetical protein
MLMKEQLTDTLFLVGTGAEIGAWTPITAAILDVAPEAPIEMGCPDHANFFMAELIAINRAIAATKQASNPHAPTPIPDNIRALRDRISVRLQEAAEKEDIQLRPFFKNVLRSAEWGDSKCVLTANWDTLIEKDFPDLPVFHMHGCVTEPTGLYLPSDYAFDPAHSRDTQQSMFKAQDQAINQLWNARTVCIYGLSLDPLDNELAAIVHTGLGKGNNTTEKIVLFNLEHEQKRITDRLRILLRERDMPLPIEFRAVTAEK